MNLSTVLHLKIEIAANKEKDAMFLMGIQDTLELFFPLSPSRRLEWVPAVHKVQF